jgi:hypothetical protein
MFARDLVGEGISMAKGVPAILLWAFVGALLGVGFIAILSIGGALLLAGVVLAAATAWLTRGRGLWAAVIAFGLFPAAILFFDILSAPPPCPTQPVNVTSGSYTCGGMPPSYTYLALTFLGIAVVGALIPLALRLLRGLRAGQGTTPTDAG